MTNRPLDRLLGTSDHDPGCEAAFEVMDQYVDAVLQGGDVRRMYAAVVAHLENCAACREDTEGLLAAIRQLKAPPREK
jgi:predicted anti-sigma-YlaC factor YlaD